MPVERKRNRVRIYSHDSFGLGHLRRCSAIAQALVDQDPNMSVLILSGSPIIGSFDFRPRVDFVRVPGVIKLSDGEYTSHSLDMDVEETLALRASIIRHTAEAFGPDIFLVDKEPLGLRGEVGETLEFLKSRGTPLVLGLRDVMDEPALLAPEWKRKNVLPALRDLYDEIWVYGLPQVCNPLADIDLPRSVHRKITYTGYLGRNTRSEPRDHNGDAPFPEPWLLVTAGGVVAMGGHNTFCEILSFDKPALIVPRMVPRLEQFMRASRAQDLGLVKCLVDKGPHDPRVMATALRHLPQQSRPSEVVVPGLLDGLPNVNRLAKRLLSARTGPRVAVAQQG